MWWSSFWHIYYSKKFMRRLLLAKLIQSLYQGYLIVPPLSSVYKENACFSNPTAPGYLHQPLFQMEDRLHNLQSHFLCRTQLHYRSCGLFHEMGQIPAHFPGQWRNYGTIPIQLGHMSPQCALHDCYRPWVSFSESHDV